MMKSLPLYIYILCVSLLCSCSVNKFIPDGSYLLDEVNIESDTKEVNPSQFSSYIRQNPITRVCSRRSVVATLPAKALRSASMQTSSSTRHFMPYSSQGPSGAPENTASVTAWKCSGPLILYIRRSSCGGTWRPSQMASTVNSSWSSAVSQTPTCG